MKIGKRLQMLEQMISKPYEHVWDCCCDHGLLGMKLLQSQRHSNLHFVDIVSPLMVELETKLTKYFSKADFEQRWQVHCLDVSQIKLSNSQSQLIIIAGVGGDKMVNFVTSILESHPSQPIDFLLCPVHHNYKVRKALKEAGLGLIEEVLVEENKRFYELLYVSTKADKTISCVGSEMWDLTRHKDREYLDKTIKHYLLKSQAKGADYQQIISAYRALL